MRQSRPEIVKAAERARTIGAKRAAREMGVKVDTVRRYMRNHGFGIGRKNYDLELEVLTAIASVNPGLTLTQTELGKLLGISKQAVSALEAKALEKIRRATGNNERIHNTLTGPASR